MSDWDGFVSNVNTFGRARSYMFKWTVPPLFLGNILGGADYRLRTASIPESSVEELSTYFMGQQYKTGGARRFSDWTVTISCDNNFLLNIRMFFEVWMNLINYVPFDISYFGADIGIPPVLSAFAELSYGTGEGEGTLSGYYADQVLSMINEDSIPTLIVGLKQSWPKSIGAISLDHSSTDFAQFDVTFGYMYHYII